LVERTAVRPASLLIHGTGDVNLDPGYVSGLHDHGFAWAWSGIGGLFERDDLTVVNLECPVATSGTAQGKRYVFRGDPGALPAMRAAGVEVANLANNHALDLGVDAMLETRRRLSANGIYPVGAGADGREAAAPTYRVAQGRRIAVIGLTDILTAPTWAASRQRPGVASTSGVGAAVGTIREAQRNADVVVVTIHWGTEKSPSVTARQRTLARHMIDAGADVIFGHHPHVLQPLEWYRGRPVFYSLGNFVWRRSWVESYAGGIAEVRISTEGQFSARLRPTYLESSGHPVLRG
jgi:poly-gamma-glutamate synthesis protein (capsule biosynthesis protein)